MADHLQLGPWQWRRGYSSRFIVNTERQQLWRFGWGARARSIKRNYEWLEKTQNVVAVPRALGLWSVGLVVISCEALAPGEPLAPADITPERVNEILVALAPLYNSQTFIHGDLTHRNILRARQDSGQAAQKFYFIDGDRSTLAAPEFDVWLLLADSIAHSQGQSSHRLFIKQLIDTSPEDEPYRSAVEKLYDLVPKLQGRRLHWPRLWGQFVARCLAHSVVDCRRRGKAIDWVDGLA